MYYGAPGSGKSTAAATIVKHLFQQTGKTARVLVGDGSAATYEDMGLVDAGAVEIADFTIRDWPISTLAQFAEGAWPEDPLDPKSDMIPATPESMANLAITVFEGVSMAGLYIMGDARGGLSDRAARGERIGGESEVKIIDAELDRAGKIIPGTGPGRAYGGHTQAHYGEAQKRLAGVIERSKRLPGWVIWTAHEREADRDGERIVGPEGVGKAATPQMHRVFGNTLHFVTAVKTAKQVDKHTGQTISVVDTVYRIHTKDHFKAEGKAFGKYLATTRITHPEMLPKCGYLESNIPGSSILEFYSIVEQSKAKAKAALVRPVVAPVVAS